MNATTTNEPALAVWMRANGHTNSTLAALLECSYELIYKLSTGKIAPTNGFRWVFAQHFGWETANEVLGGSKAITEPDLMMSPAST